MDAGRTTLELVITCTKEGAPKRVPVSRILSTIGSSDEADIRLPDLASRWGMLQRKGGAVTLHVIDSGEQHHLTLGQPIALGAVTLTVHAVKDRTAPWPVEQLAEELVTVDAPAAAIQRLVDFVRGCTRASVGAILLDEQGSYGVAATSHAEGESALDASSLLSDTVVMDVLSGEGTVLVSDASTDPHYGQVPSVLRRGLRAFVCLPLMVGNRTLGALYLADHRGVATFDESTVRDLRVLCGMAGPYLIQLRRATMARDASDGPIGDCSQMVELRELIAKVGPADISVLVSGETGTGKEVTARALHRASRRAQGSFVAVNCSSVPESLMEAELFGCKKGAFTGAHADRVGLIEAANGGTLFLDEIGDMPLPMQVALLRVVQERELTRVGETTPRPVDFRLITASHKDLEAEVAAGRFRSDLLFRVAEVTLRLPRLADRGDDIALLARLFLHQAVRELGIPARTLSHSAEEALSVHDWPGNVRELCATMRRAAVLASGIEIDAVDLHLPGARPSAPLPPATGNGVPAQAQGASGEGVSFAPLDLSLAEARARFACVYAQAVLERFGGDREATARSLAISLRSLYRYLQ